MAYSVGSQFPVKMPTSVIFNKFSQATNAEVSQHFYSWVMSNINFNHFTLDFDSSVITRYGKQEGAKKGYNPNKRGRLSHHPL